jgi:MoaA/NifB/PqqE/SkfB family radical SAM enzyme
MDTLDADRVEDPVAPLRLDTWLRDLTRDTPRPNLPPLSAAGPSTLPEPPFPRRPDLLGDWAGQPLVQERHYTAAQVRRKARGWLMPYLKSRVLPGDFHPIVCYLLTDYKCNVDCNYCPSWNNRAPGMSEDIARRSIDWLHSTTCRVLAIMGGEPLVRPTLVHRIVDYASSRGFWVYMGTNGRLLTPDLIDRLGDAGLAVFNVAMDVLDEKPGLPKALNPLRSRFEYLLRKQYAYGYLVFFNVCICRNNLEDVQALTEEAHDYGIAIDYHICESPMYTYDHFRHLDDNPNFVRAEDWPRVDALIDWLIEKNQAGYQMVNSVKRLQDMKAFMRGKVEPWNCRAGLNCVIIRMDGTLGPCSPCYGVAYDWGHIGKPKFDRRQLEAMKTECQRNCFSTLNHNLGFCYNDRRVARWLLTQFRRGFRTGARAFE